MWNSIELLKFGEKHNGLNFVTDTKICIELAMFAVIVFPDWWKQGTLAGIMEFYE